LTALVVAVAANFVRSPLLGTSGSEAVAPAGVTLWVPGPVAGGEGMKVAEEAAAALELAGRPTAVKVIGGGSSQGLAGFLARRQPRHGANLLLLTSSTLADLAYDRHESLVPGVAAQALIARELLLRSHSLGVLAEAPLQLAVTTSSPIQGGPELMSALRERRSARLVSLSEDSFSRVELAALMQRAGVIGLVRFRVQESGQAAVRSAQSGLTSAVLAPHPALAEEERAGRLRGLDWPLDGGRAPRERVELIAPPRLEPGRVAHLRHLIGRLTGGPGWRKLQRRSGRLAPRPDEVRLRGMTHRELAEAEAGELLSRDVEGRSSN
jgi:hypothetical protein